MNAIPAGKPTGSFEPGLATETLIKRVDAPAPCFPLLASMFVEKGARADWDLLHDLHYKAETLPIGPRFWKLTLEGETIGVLVTGNPKGLLKERHIVFPAIKPGTDTKLTNTTRFQYINRHFRVVSRFVVDTMYRGIGAGYRMMNLVSRMEGNTFMEIQSSMSKFNLFGQKAGFRFLSPRNANKYEAGLIFFRGHFESSPQDFEAILAELETKGPAEREHLLQACKNFYFRNSSREKTGNTLAYRDGAQERVNGKEAREIIQQIQQLTLASPMYGVWKRPDNLPIPQRLPLSAFDWQKPNEPFKDKST